jgi:hypothetical protein
MFTNIIFLLYQTSGRSYLSVHVIFVSRYSALLQDLTHLSGHELSNNFYMYKYFSRTQMFI